MNSSRQDPFTLVDLLLAEQQDLSPVERFARLPEFTELPPPSRYQHLIPLSKPGPGEQYSFTVDLDRCSGCKACVSACHSLNGLEEGETWRTVGTILGENSETISITRDGTVSSRSTPYLQTITAACHHCIDPACSNGCPVLAYEKDPATGIVRHLDDQCIGCQYCILKCPYDVPKYSRRKGIVRKCDMCHGRLVHGEAPACVQACPHEAIRIDVVNQEVVRASASLHGARMIPGAFDSSYTLPTTQYQSQKPIPLRASPANHEAFSLQSAHWPLVLMLILTQAGAGLHLLNALFAFRGAANFSLLLSAAAFAAVIFGLASSVLHLGRPLKAWRAVLGWRRSWMSREIIAFGVYLLLAAVVLFVSDFFSTAMTAIASLIAVFCSAMIYVDTRRLSWRTRAVFPKFFGTVLLLGTTIAAALAGWLSPEDTITLLWVATLIRTALFLFAGVTFRKALRDTTSPLHSAARTAVKLAPAAISARLIFFVVSTAFSLLAIFSVPSLAPICGAIACVSTLVSEILERWLFFTTVAAPGMPG